MGIFPILQWRLGYSEIFNYPSQKKSSSTKNLPQVCMLLKLFHSYHCADRIGEGINELNTFGATTHAMKWSWTVSSVQFSCSVVSNSSRPHELQHVRPPCPSLTPRVYSNSSPLSQWWHPTTSSSVMPFSSCLLSFPASGSFQMSQFFTSGGQRIRVSALTSVLPMNVQDWFPLGWTAWISLQSKGLSRVFSNTTVQKHQVSFFTVQLSSIHDHWKNYILD